MTDAELALEVRDGSRAALGQAYARYHRLARQILAERRETVDVDDLTQEAFLGLPAELRRRYDGRHTLGHHVFRSVLRARRLRDTRTATGGPVHRRRGPVEAALSLEDFQSLTPEEAAAMSERARLVAVLVARLKGPHRAALMACEVDGLSIGEAAASLRVSPRLLSLHLSRARFALEQFAAGGPLEEVFAAMPRRRTGPSEGQRSALRELLRDGAWHSRAEVYRVAGGQAHPPSQLLAGLPVEKQRIPGRGMEHRYRLAQRCA